jgi:hypothetical protein
LPTELTDLIDRVAEHPHGLGFLHQAYLDSVAVTLGVHPFVVEAARAYLETPTGRATMITRVREARERASERPRSRSSSAGVVTSAVETKSPEELIDEARKHPLGVEFLLHAPPETVAVTFHVHPFVVFRARVLSRNRGAGGVEPGRTED